MSDLIVSGKDAVTGQQRTAGPDDRLTDTDGTPVAGLFKDVNTQSVVHTGGDNYLHPLANYSFAAGQNNKSFLPHSFLQGKDNYFTTNNPVFSYNTVLPKYQAAFIQGYNNTKLGGYSTFLQGYDNYQGPYGYVRFMQGGGNVAIGDADIVQGYGNYTDGGFTQVMIGFGNSTTSGVGSTGFARGFMHGFNNTFDDANTGVGPGDIFIQGAGNGLYFSVAETPNFVGHFLQGNGNLVYGGEATFSQGNANRLYGINTSSLFVQGRYNHLYGDNNVSQFAQGRNNKVYNSSSFAQGEDNVTNHYNMFVQGTDCSADNGPYTLNYGGVLSGAFAQGSNCIATGGYGSFAQGAYCYAAGACLAQGAEVTVTDFNSFGQGAGITNTGKASFAQGGKPGTFGNYRIHVTGKSSFAQGYFVDMFADYSFGQGVGISVTSTANYSLVQGRDNTTYNGYGPSYRSTSYTLIQGRNNQARIANALVQGHNNIADSIPYLYAPESLQGTLVQGYNNQALAGYAQLVQGHGNDTASPGWYSLVQGAFNHSEASLSFVQGFGNYLYYTIGGGGLDSTGALVQGDGNTVGVDVKHAFAQGSYNTIAGSTRDCFAQGYRNTVSESQSMAQGHRITIPGRQTFAQGYDITLTPSYGGSFNTTYYYSNLVQGANITLYSYGYGCNLVQGYKISTDYAGGGPFGLGGAYSSIIQGNNIDASVSWYSIVQGRSVSAYCFGSLVQGDNSDVFCGLSLFQGHSHTTTGYATRNLVQGTLIKLYGADVVNPSGSNGIQNSLLQGAYHTITGSRTFAQGISCDVPRDDQKTWGSNRGGQSIPNGEAQSSKMVKHVRTTDAIPTTLVTLDLEEDKSYAISVMVIARDNNDDDESACFSLDKALAYLDTGGSVTLVGSDTSGSVTLTAVSSGVKSDTWDVTLEEELTSNSIVLKVAGSADVVNWCADFNFVEVKG